MKDRRERNITALFVRHIKCISLRCQSRRRFRRKPSPRASSSISTNFASSSFVLLLSLAGTSLRCLCLCCLTDVIAQHVSHLGMCSHRSLIHSSGSFVGIARLLTSLHPSIPPPQVSQSRHPSASSASASCCPYHTTRMTDQGRIANARSTMRRIVLRAFERLARAPS